MLQERQSTRHALTMAEDKNGNYFDRIVVDPAIQVGKPVIKGTRIPVSIILNMLGNSYDFAQIRAAYPDLDDEDIKAAIAYAAARINREEVRPFNRPV